MSQDSFQVNLPVQIHFKAKQPGILIRKKAEKEVSDKDQLDIKRKEEDEYFHKLIGRKHDYFLN